MTRPAAGRVSATLQMSEVIDARTLALASLLPEHFPRVREAVAYCSSVAAETWRGWAEGQPLPSGRTIHARTGAYARSIHDDDRSTGGTIEHEVYSDAPYARALDEGTEERDLKSALLMSMRARTARGGTRYMFVPFRHATESDATGIGYGAGPRAHLPGFRGGNVLPPGIISWFKRQEGGPGGRKSAIVDQGRRINDARTAAIPSFRYQWGARYPGGALQGERSKVSSAGNYTWKAGLYQGMTHFGAQRAPQHGEYMTFRTVSENSDPSAWMRPAVAPLRVREQLVESLRPTLCAVVTEAARLDVADLVSRRNATFGGGGGRRG